MKGINMKKILFIVIATLSLVGNTFAYQVLSTKEFGKNDAKNQNVVVKCTTAAGATSEETCSLRRYAKCNKDKTDCNAWQPWRDLRDTTTSYPDWKAAASGCCRKKGLR